MSQRSSYMSVLLLFTLLPRDTLPKAATAVQSPDRCQNSLREIEGKREQVPLVLYVRIPALVIQGQREDHPSM